MSFSVLQVILGSLVPSGRVNDLNLHNFTMAKKEKIRDASHPDETEVISFLMHLHCGPSVVCVVVVDSVDSLAPHCDGRFMYFFIYATFKICNHCFQK